MPTANDVLACLGDANRARFTASAFMATLMDCCTIGDATGVLDCIFFAFASGLVNGNEKAAVTALIEQGGQ